MEQDLIKSYPTIFVAKRFRIVIFNYPLALIYVMKYLPSPCDLLDHKNPQVC